jgi:nanoRNase/pAp phosphatase (c-di-AMP/oligoRNAs hydrolase)
LNTLELIAGDRLAIMTLPSRAFVDCGATTADTEDIVNEPLRIGSVVVSVLLVDDGSGIVRVSFRSKPQQAGLPSIRDAAVRERGGELVPTKSGGRADVATKAPQANDDGASSTSARVPRPSRSEGGGTDAPVDIDVAEVAHAFGGGGHTRAAGSRIKGNLPDVRRKIVAHLSHALTV